MLPFYCSNILIYYSKGDSVVVLTKDMLAEQKAKDMKTVIQC